MGTKGRLRRCFPGPAIAIDHEKLEDPSFCDALAELLTQLDINTPLEAIPIVHKARSKTSEIRDTVHPKFITEMLTGLLRGIGRTHDVVRFHKCTRDDVLWNNALKPWRRSPLWLLIRVALQATLIADRDNHTLYKSFMVFFMAQILEHAVKQCFPSDIIFMISAKISRRTLKLDVRETSNWLSYVEKVVRDAHRVIAARWHSMEEHADPLALQRAWKPSELCFQTDTQLSLLGLQPYLAGILARSNRSEDIAEFQPTCHSRLSHGVIIPPSDTFQPGTDFTARLSVLDVERWVETSLGGWLSHFQATQMACSPLASLLENYIQASPAIYKDDPVNVSLMLLTSMELWVALDRCTIHQHSLLKDYNPGFPTGLFDSILLPQWMQMNRLARVEQYLDQRRRESTHRSELIFEACDKENSFAIKYFEQSDYHQQLQSQIENVAELAREEKEMEYRNKTQQHQGLVQAYTSKSCEQEWRWNGYREEPYHLPHCQRCQIKREADNIEIRVHEWPLPNEPLEAKAAVFELDVPATIAKWREITYALIVDIFSPQKVCSLLTSTKVYALHNFDGLSEYSQGYNGRLHLASTAKSFLVSHYRSKKITLATISNICVNNGLRYAIYDSKLCEWTSELLNQCDVRRICTFQLPPGPFQKLQYMVDGTTHTSNQVLARQSDCPPDFNLHEFYAFASLRSGHRLQWLNIARELATRILKFNQQETHWLVVQAAWQAGCSGDSTTYRDSHIDLNEEEFGLSFSSALKEALGTIEGNWQGAVALRTFVVLAARLLSMSTHHKIHEICYLYLRQARNVALKWGRDVGQLCHEEIDEEALKALNMRALEIALTCHSTFDVDQDHLFALLKTSEDVAGLTECCITIHDRCPTITNHISRSIKTFLRRYERTSHFLEPHLRKHIVEDHAGIDKTVHQTWSGYRPGTPWSALPLPNERWLVTRTSDQGSYCPVTVHYNLLNGSLLVNGLPLTRLPCSYELNSTYCRILGEVNLSISLAASKTGLIYVML